MIKSGNRPGGAAQPRKKQKEEEEVTMKE